MTRTRFLWLPKFQSTLPTRGSDQNFPIPLTAWTKFQSTLPTRGSDIKGCRKVARDWYFNPRSPRGGATAALYQAYFGPFISIHAPHEGERLKLITIFQLNKPISIHAPHEGERPVACAKVDANGVFQSTLPTRGSDFIVVCIEAYNLLFQSTLPTRGSDCLRL